MKFRGTDHLIFVGGGGGGGGWAGLFWLRPSFTLLSEDQAVESQEIFLHKVKVDFLITI